VALASLLGLGLASAAGCQGPDQFFRLADAGQPTGTAGSVDTGRGGTTGAGGEGGTLSPAGNAGATGHAGAAGGSAGSIGTGSAGVTGSAGTTGAAGALGAGGAAGSTGARGGTTGTAGTTGAAGVTGSAGTTGAGGAAGVPAGRGGTTGSAGATGAAGAGGSTGGRGGTTGSAGRGGTTGTAGSGGSGGPNRLQIVAKCQGNNDAQNVRVTLKILNPESVAKQWSDIKVRYYFTPNMPLAPMVTFDFLQKFTSAQLTTTATESYVEIGFTTGAGMISGFDTVTGSDQIQLRLYNFTTPTWNTMWDDDYSNKSCTGVANTDAYTDRLTMPGYYQGQLAWGSEPAY